MPITKHAAVQRMHMVKGKGEKRGEEQFEAEELSILRRIY